MKTLFYCLPILSLLMLCTGQENDLIARNQQAQLAPKVTHVKGSNEVMKKNNVNISLKRQDGGNANSLDKRCDVKLINQH